MWASPGAAPADRGDAGFAMILDGRYLRQNLRIAARDKPFERLGYIGYDTAQRRYFSSWMDLNFTGIILADGTMTMPRGPTLSSGRCPIPLAPGRRSRCVKSCTSSTPITSL